MANLAQIIYRLTTDQGICYSTLSDNTIGKAIIGENGNISFSKTEKYSPGSTLNYYGTIVRIGIQAPPGTEFILDGISLLVPYSGQFEHEGNKKIQFNSNNPPSSFVIDYEYTTGEGSVS